MGDSVESKADIKIDHPAGPWVVTTRRVTITGLWSGSDLRNPTVEVELNGVKKTVAPDGSRRWEVSFGGVPNGTYTVTAKLFAEGKGSPAFDSAPITIQVASG
jgi:hypothetical protein